jgi:hypothetical protein
MPRRLKSVVAGALSAGDLLPAGSSPSRARARCRLNQPRTPGASITGAFEGWYQNSDGTFSLLVGYMNRNLKQTLDIPVGPNNRIRARRSRSWTADFLRTPSPVGRLRDHGAEDFGSKKLTWTIVSNGQTTTIPLNLNDLWVVEPFKGRRAWATRRRRSGSRRTALHTRGRRMELLPHTPTAVKQPLMLTAWVTDDGFRAPESRDRTGGPATLRWSKFRGPGPVQFDDESPRA